MSNSSKQQATAVQVYQDVKDIKWNMLDKRKYLPLAIVNMGTVRTLLYPLTVVRTRLQVQTHRSFYTGTWDALTTMLKYEGVGSLYKGYWVNSLQFLPYFIGITSYESVRQHSSLLIGTDNVYATAFIGGATGAVFAQLFSVPLDIVTQHMMLVGQKGSSRVSPTSTNPMPETSSGHAGKIINRKTLREIERIHVPESVGNSSSTLSIAKYIVKEVYKNEKFLGFYRGYVLSTLLVSLNSGIWWSFYFFYQGRLKRLLPNDFPDLALKSCCGPLCSISANFITNPVDVMRTRMQVTKRRESLLQVLRVLWQQDGYGLFWKGLTARLSYSCLYSFFIIFGYEAVKKFSLKEEYQRMLYPLEYQPVN